MARASAHALPARRRAAPRARTAAARERPGRLRRRALLLVLASLLVSGAWLWLRDSSLVAVKHVQVRGLAGSEAGAIQRAITAAGGDMTTLHARPELVGRALRSYPTVRSVQVEASFPQTLRVTVVMHQAVAVAAGPRGATAVAEDGTLLPRVGTGGLPRLRAPSSSIGDAEVSGPAARDALLALAAIPAPDRRQVAAAYSGPRGIVIELRDGPRLYLGAPSRLAEKWAVAARLLRDAVARQAAYIDVRLPERPAVGGAGDLPAASGGASGGAQTATATPAPAPAPAPQATAPSVPSGAPAPGSQGGSGTPATPAPVPTGGAQGGP